MLKIHGCGLKFLSMRDNAQKISVISGFLKVKTVTISTFCWIMLFDFDTSQKVHLCGLKLRNGENPHLGITMEKR